MNTRVRVRTISAKTAVFLSLVIAAVGITTAQSARPALAASDLRYQSHSTFDVDPVGAVHVSVDITVTNTKADSGQYYYYFDEIVAGVVANAANVRADYNGRALGVTVAPVSRYYARATIRLSPTLRSRQTQVVHLKYDIPPTAPRSGGVNRVNAAYMSFVAFGGGDPGLVSVDVNVPSAFNTEYDFEDMETEELDGVTRYRAEAITDPDWGVVFTIRNDDALRVEEFTVAGHDIELRSWPDDGEWAAYVRKHLSSGIPALERLVGSKLPETSTLTITETAALYIYGYAGVYKSIDNSIEIGDALSADVILHEVSHQWFNDEYFADRWVSEGLAEEISTRAGADIKIKVTTPKVPDQEAITNMYLNDWDSPNFSGADPDATEAYGYNASFYVMRELQKEIGPKAMESVVQSAIEHREVYKNSRGHIKREEAYDWRTMFDAFDRIGGSEKATQLFVKYVVDTSDEFLIGKRNDFVKDFDKLAAAGGSWSNPDVIVDHAINWQFGPARHDDVKLASSIIATRDSLTKRLATLATPFPKSIEQRYETATSTKALEAVRDDIKSLEAATNAVVAAHVKVDAERSLWQKFGMLGADTDAPLAKAAASLTKNEPAIATAQATAVTERQAESGRIGAWRVGKTGGALFLVLLTLWCCHLVFKQRRDAEAAAATGSAHH